MDYYWGSSFIVGLEVGGIIDLGVGPGVLVQYSFIVCQARFGFYCLRYLLVNVVDLRAGAN